MVIPAGWGALGFTSGRRTYKGNKLVGGVGNSHHLDGTAADFTAPLSVLRKQFPNNPILDEGDHRHVSGLSDVPYYGNRGVAGLVNGVDTTAPKGPPMQRRNPIFEAMSRPVNGIDPLAPMPAPMTPMMGQMPPQMAAQPQMAPQMPQQPPMGHGKPKLNAAAIMGILGDALSAYGGQRGVFAPMMMQQRQDESEENRFQQHLAAQVEAARRKAEIDAQTPPQWLQDAQTFQHLPADAKQSVLDYRNALYPVIADIAQPDGSVFRQQINRQLPSGGPKAGTVEDGYIFMGGDAADPNNWRQQ